MGRVPVDWMDVNTTSEHHHLPHKHNPYAAPTVYGQPNVQGAEYNDDTTVNERHSAFRIFPSFHITPLFRHRGTNVRPDCFNFNAGVEPVDIRGGFPFLGGS